MGHEVVEIYVDEDGALARSSEFCLAVRNESCILLTTGGGNSSSNGQVERSNQYDANIVRPGLSTMNMLMGKELPEDMNIEMFWCFALQQGTLIRRRLYNRMKGDSPYFLVHKRRPSVRELVPCGSIMTIIAPNKKTIPKLSRERAFLGYFCAFGNNFNFHIYWDPKSPREVKRSYHSIIEDVATFAKLENKIFSTVSSSTPDTTLPMPPEEVKSAIVNADTFNSCPNGFFGKKIYGVTITLPAASSPIGIQLQDDLMVNLPFIQNCLRN